MSDMEIRTPPQDLQAEMNVIASLLMSAEAAKKVFAKLRSEHFYREVNRRIFEACYQLWMNKQPLDVTVLANTMRQSGDLDRVGGYTGLVQIFDRPVAPSNAEYYADIVLQKSCLREMIASGTRIVGEAYADSKPFDELMVDFRRLSIQAMDAAAGAQEFDDDPTRRVDVAIQELSENRSGITDRFIPTGFRKLDAIIRGWERRKLTVVSGFKSSAKSTFIQQCSLQQAEMLVKVGYCMVDVERQEIDYRFACRKAEVRYDDLWSRDPMVMSDKKFDEVLSHLEALKLYPIYSVGQDSIGRSVDKFCMWARQAVERRGVDVIYVDSATKFRLIRGYGENEEGAVSEMVNRISELAIDLNIAIVCISEKSRAGALKGSGTWDYTARAHYDFAADADDKSLIRVTFEKRSNSSRDGGFLFRLNGEHFQLIELDPSQYKPSNSEEERDRDRRPAGRP